MEKLIIASERFGTPLVSKVDEVSCCEDVVVEDSKACVYVNGST